MNIKFSKYQGAGNDFILIDHRESELKNIENKLVAQLCDRRFGIGADGLMFLTNHNDYDFEMVYYNADGKIGSMCGNGGRCIVAFAKSLGIIDFETDFLAVDGPHYAKISTEGNWVELQMIDVDSINKDGNAFVLNTGSPHYVAQVDNLASLDVFKIGKDIRNNDTYKQEGINVNFVENKEDYLFVRTFERGVEDETYACGTGVTAVAMAMAQQKAPGYIETPIKVLGGKLQVNFNYDGNKFTNVFLCGPAEKVFDGEIDL
ncbi:MAG: diaminopimelate epimerase [Sphingobacteriaceae bacterium]|nr:diaminopimelate epimerase [Sphingobacteriaceae bacterium]